MASGVAVADSVLEMFNDMKVINNKNTKNRVKGCVFCITPDKRSIVPEEGKTIYVGDACESGDLYKQFVELLPHDDCRYALFDCSFTTSESKKQELIFIFWAPDEASTKAKMIYASSKDALKKKLNGIKHEWQANSLAEIKDPCCLAEKLGGSKITSLEGRAL